MLSKLDSNSNRQAIITPPIVILAGGCNKFVQDTMESYRSKFIDSFSNFKGTILSGGSPEGIASIAADIGESYPGMITTIGYLPSGQIADSRYSFLITSLGNDFSLVDILQMWSDILRTGCNINQVRLIGVNGGDISMGEYRLAIAMGAKVGIIKGSGRSADEIIFDPLWGQMVTQLEATVEDIRKFINNRLC